MLAAEVVLFHLVPIQQDLSPINTGIIDMCQGMICFISKLLPPTECGQCGGTLMARYGQRSTDCLIDVFRLPSYISSAQSNWFKTHDCHLIYTDTMRCNIQWRWPFRQFISFSPPSLTGKCMICLAGVNIYICMLIHLYSTSRFSMWALWLKLQPLLSLDLFERSCPMFWHSELIENACDHIAFVV